MERPYNVSVQQCFYQLQNNNYQIISKSKYLPRLASSNLIGFVNRGLKESPLTIEADFIKQFDSP